MGGGQATPPGSPRMSSGPLPRTNAFPDPGNFGPHPDREMLKNMYDAITRLDLWSWLQKFTPEKDKGFMFTMTPEIMAIGTETNEMGHSGSSFAFCMRNMEVIAKKGWVTYYQEYIAPHFMRPLQ